MIRRGERDAFTESLIRLPIATSIYPANLLCDGRVAMKFNGCVNNLCGAHQVATVTVLDSSTYVVEENTEGILEARVQKHPYLGQISSSPAWAVITYCDHHGFAFYISA